VRTRGQVGGEEAHQLILTEMAAHDHGGSTGGVHPAWYEDTFAAFGDDLYGVADQEHSHLIPSAGGDVAHNTMHPFQVCEFIIKT
jgi:microcystin-dependent protein